MNCKRNEIIKQILNDDACFFKLEKEEAYIILEDIGIANDQVESVYSKLISSDIFYDLLNNKKIKENDEELKVKYKTYDSDIFKKKDFKKENIEEKSALLPKVKKENFFKRLIRNIKKMLHKN